VRNPPNLAPERVSVDMHTLYALSIHMCALLMYTIDGNVATS